MDIGSKIKEVAEGQRLSQEALGLLINTSKQNVGDIYKRKTLDTDLLVNLSVALNYDFLEQYYYDNPLSSLENNLFTKLKMEVKKLSEALEREREFNIYLKKGLEDKDKIIKCLEDK